MIKHYLLLAVFLLAGAGALHGEEAITKFDEKFAISVFSNYNIGIFSNSQNQGVRTDEPWKIGMGIRYKNYSAFFSIPLDLKFNTFDLELNYYFEKLYFEAFWKRYQNYFDAQTDDEISVKTNAELDIMSAGVTAGWICSHHSHSLSAVYDMDRKQNASSGSFLYGFGVYYSSIYSGSARFERYNERSRIIHFGPMAGYSHTWVLPRNMFFNAAVSVGANLGINAAQSAVMFIPQIRPKMSFGRHGSAWSINAVMGCNSMILLRRAADYDIITPATITITFSKRF